MRWGLRAVAVCLFWAFCVLLVPSSSWGAPAPSTLERSSVSHSQSGTSYSAEEPTTAGCTVETPCHISLSDAQAEWLKEALVIGTVGLSILVLCALATLVGSWGKGAA